MRYQTAYRGSPHTSTLGTMSTDTQEITPEEAVRRALWMIKAPSLWAYQRVKNISRLKQLAIEKQLIWAEGSIFERTEIMSKRVRLELRRLESGSRSHGA